MLPKGHTTTECNIEWKAACVKSYVLTMVFQIVFKYIQDNIKICMKIVTSLMWEYFKSLYLPFTLLLIIRPLVSTLTQQRKNHEEVQVAVNSPLLKKTEWQKLWVLLSIFRSWTHGSSCPFTSIAFLFFNVVIYQFFVFVFLLSLLLLCHKQLTCHVLYPPTMVFTIESKYHNLSVLVAAKLAVTPTLNAVFSFMRLIPVMLLLGKPLTFGFMWSLLQNYRLIWLKEPNRKKPWKKCSLY